MNRKLISFDWAIKKILRSKANFGILEGFLSELLFTDIQMLEILESESNQETQDNKFNRVDIKVKDSDEKIYLIEIQFSRELDYMQRILYATSKAITEYLPQGSPYADVNKIISISILHFDLGKGDDYIYHGTTQFVGLHSKHELQLSEKQKKLYSAQNIADLYPEYYLIELRNFDNIAKDKLDEWIYFLKNESIGENFTAKGLEQAKETLDVLKMPPEDRAAYERHQEDLHYHASMFHSSYEIGKLEGEQENTIKIAKKMKQAGMSAENIAEMTGLSVEQIESL